MADVERTGKIIKWQKNVGGNRPFGRVRFKWEDNIRKDLKEKWEGCGTHPSVSGSGLQAASSERGNGSSGRIKDDEFRLFGYILRRRWQLRTYSVE
jgi:hypothetical protein